MRLWSASRFILMVLRTTIRFARKSLRVSYAAGLVCRCLRSMSATAPLKHWPVVPKMLMLLRLASFWSNF